MSVKLNIIVAVDEKLGIGKKGALPWHLSNDLKHFKDITTRERVPNTTNAVIMGRKTWESIDQKFRPLPRRINVVLSRQKDLKLPEGVLLADSLPSALNLLAGDLKSKVGDVFIIGGAQVFKEALESPLCRQIYLTRIQGTYDCDVAFPEIPHDFMLIAESTPETQSNISFSFCEYIR